MSGERKNVEDIWEIIIYNYDQIRYAEIKSSVVISVYSLFFTAAYTIDVLDDENVYSFSFASFWDYFTLIFLIPGVYFTLFSFSKEPDFQGATPSPIASVPSKSVSVYLESTSPDKYALWPVR